MTRLPRIPAAGLTLIALAGLTACTSAPRPASQPGTASSGTVVYTFGVAGTRGPVVQTLHDKPTRIPGLAGTVIQISTSNSDTYALTSAGTVWAWGVGSYGELGNGSTPAYVRTAVKVDFPKGVKITSLPNPMPFDGGLAIDSLGNAWGWGLNASHDLCLPRVDAPETFVAARTAGLLQRLESASLKTLSMISALVVITGRSSRR